MLDGSTQALPLSQLCVCELGVKHNVHALVFGPDARANTDEPTGTHGIVTYNLHFQAVEPGGPFVLPNLHDVSNPHVVAVETPHKVLCFHALFVVEQHNQVVSCYLAMERRVFYGR